jgi:hypothetical protein
VATANFQTLSEYALFSTKQVANFKYFDLFYRLSYSIPDEKVRFQRIMYTILFKGAGDLYQEINAVCKNGGYIGVISYNGDIIRWDNATEHAKRLFVAKDRPSGCRFIFFRKFGRPEEINQLAYGGYWDESESGKKMIYYHGNNTAAYNGGVRNARQIKQNKINKQTKKNKINRQIKQNKINRQTKKKRLIKRTKKRLIIRKNKRQTKRR